MNTIVEILIDKSGSMGFMKGSEKYENEYLLEDGSTRTDLIKKMMIDEILPTIDYAQNITIRTFRTIGKDLKQVEIKPIYEGEYNESEIIKTIKSLENPPFGGTPISAALEKSIEELSKHDTKDRKIILLTDGEENMDGNYIEIAKKAMEMKGIPCKIFIVGLNQDESASKKAKQLAVVTNGNYLNVNTINYNKEYVKNILRPLKTHFIGSSLDNLISKNSEDKNTNAKTKLLDQRTTEKSDRKLEINHPEKPNKVLNERSASSNENETEKITAIDSSLKQVVEKNSKALSLVTKQLENLSQEILSLKGSYDNSEQEEILIHENSELNEKVREVSERLLFDKLERQYSDRLKWLNQNGESGANHDFEIIDEDNSIEYFIECKATKGNEKFFLITKNEWELFINNTKNYQIYFLSNVLSSPDIIKIDNLLDWILKGKIYPMSHKNRKVKAERIMMTLKG